MLPAFTSAWLLPVYVNDLAVGAVQGLQAMLPVNEPLAPLRQESVGVNVQLTV